VVDEEYDDEERVEVEKEQEQEQEEEEEEMWIRPYCENRYATLALRNKLKLAKHLSYELHKNVTQ
jgi:hypothetical protein